MLYPPALRRYPLHKVLTIAGSDSGGGAGIQADLKAFAARGVYGMSAITALTAQNTQGVQGIYPVPPDFIALQIDTVMEDIGADAWKTGMLASADVIETIAERARHHKLPILVVDPVMVAKGGDNLLQPEAQGALIEHLLPLATVLTPNHHEAQALTQQSIQSVEDMRNAAKTLHAMGPRYVIVKGGHLPTESDAIDVLYDGQTFTETSVPRVHTPNTHGTGCTFASALAAELAKGTPILDAFHNTKAYITKAIQAADTMNIGHGHGPLQHFPTT